MNTTRIKEEVSITEFNKIVAIHRSNITVSRHALDHLSSAQRNIFTEEDLKRKILRDNPNFVGLQMNGRYAAFYRREDNYLKLILELKGLKLEIITFINVENLPNVRTENGN